MACDALLKGTKVDGVYDADPEKQAGAKRYDQLSYMDVLAKDLKVMDASAISLSRENRIPILVFSIANEGGFDDVLQHKGAFTLVCETSER
jgi:uridylate kinase